MANVKWIKIDTDIFNDEKIAIIESMPDADADSVIIIWFKLLCLAGRQNNNGVFVLNDEMPYTDEMFAAIFRRPVASVRKALSVFESLKMIEIYDNVVTIPNWEKHQNADKLNEMREKSRESSKRYREKQKLLTNGDVTVMSPLCHGDGIEEDKDKEEDKDYTVEGELKRQNNKQIEKQNNNINKYGLFKNVILTEEQLAELKKNCPVWDVYIERLSKYMNSNNKDYNGKHYETILSWYKEDKAQGKAPTPTTTASYNIDDYKQASVYDRPVYKRKPK